jgi:hypothetical protein
MGIIEDNINVTKEYTLSEKEIQALVAKDLNVNVEEVTIKFDTTQQYDRFDSPLGSTTKVKVIVKKTDPNT